MLCPPFKCKRCGEWANCYHTDLGKLRENNTDSINFCSIACRDAEKAEKLKAAELEVLRPKVTARKRHEECNACGSEDCKRVRFGIVVICICGDCLKSITKQFKQL